MADALPCRVADEKGARYCINLACIAGYPRLGTWKEPKITESGSKAVDDGGRRQTLFETRSAPPQIDAFEWVWMAVPGVGCAMVSQHLDRLMSAFGALTLYNFIFPWLHHGLYTFGYMVVLVGLPTSCMQATMQLQPSTTAY
jgi:hypothetical protein